MNTLFLFMVMLILGQIGVGCIQAINNHNYKLAMAAFLIALANLLIFGGTK